MYNNDNMKHMQFVDVLDKTIGIIKDNFKNLMYFTLVFFLPIFLMLYLIRIFKEYYFITSLMLLVILGYIIIVKPLYESVMIRYVYDSFISGIYSNWKQLISNSIKLIPRFFLNSILYNIVLFSLIGCFYIALTLSINIIRALISAVSYLFIDELGAGKGFLIVSFFTGVAIVIITCILIIIFLYIYFRIKFCIHCIVIDDKSSTEAFSKSFEITKKSYFHLLLSTITLILMLFFTVSIVSLTSILYLNISYKEIFTYLKNYGSVLILMLYPVMVVLYSILYISLRIRSEGLDLLIQVKELKNKKKNLVED